MKPIVLENLSIIKYKNNLHQDIRSEFLMGDSKNPFINNARSRLIEASEKEEFTDQTAYIVLEEEKEIGYIYISSIKKDEVYLEYAVLKDYREKGYGKRVLNEITNYLFEEKNIFKIKLDIDPSNLASMNTAISCEFYPDEEDFTQKGYKGKLLFTKENGYYLTKKQKKGV